MSEAIEYPRLRDNRLGRVGQVFSADADGANIMWKRGQLTFLSARQLTEPGRYEMVAA